MTAFKMPEPVAHVLDRDSCKVWWSDRFTDIKQAPGKNAPLYTAQALRDVLEQAAQLDWFPVMRDGGLVTRSDAYTLAERIEEKLRALIKEIK